MNPIFLNPFWTESADRASYPPASMFREPMDSNTCFYCTGRATRECIAHGARFCDRDHCHQVHLAARQVSECPLPPTPVDAPDAAPRSLRYSVWALLAALVVGLVIWGGR